MDVRAVPIPLEVKRFLTLFTTAGHLADFAAPITSVTDYRTAGYNGHLAEANSK